MTDSACISISRNNEYSHHIADRFIHFRDEEDLVDFKIRVEDEVIGCHRVIMAAHSPVLHRMMNSAMKEGTEQQANLKSIKASTMKLLMKYMYTGDMFAKKNELIDIVQACDFLQMPLLRDECLKFVPEILNSENVICWQRLASLLDLPDISKKCKQLLRSSFSEIAKSCEFLTLNPGELKDCIEETSKGQVSSDELVIAVFTWIGSDVQGRIQAMEETMSLIKLHRCSPMLITEISQKFGHILAENSSFYKHFTESFAGKSKQPITDNESNLSLFVIGGDDNKQGWILDDNDKFQEFTRIPDDVFANGHSVCLCEDIGLVVTGGKDKKTISMYSFMSKEWNSLKTMKSTRFLHASVYNQGVLFVIGGHVDGESSFSKNVEMLALRQRDDTEWKAGPDLLETINYPQATAVGKHVFMMGVCGKLFHYVAGNNAWDSRASIPELASTTGSFRMAATEGHVFIARGWKCSCYIYYNHSNSWVKAKDPSLKHYNGSLTYHKNKLILVGGESTTIEEYDIEKDYWKIGDYKLPFSLKHHISFMVNIPE